jgi:hypothetical protein
VSVGDHAHKFLRLAVDSRLEITFVGKPHRFQAPSYKVYRCEVSEGLCVMFEVEVRIIRRFVSPGFIYEKLDIERTDFLPQYWTDRESNTSCRITSG